MPIGNEGDFKIATEDLQLATSTGGVYTAKNSQIYAGPPRWSMISGVAQYPVAGVDVVRIDSQATINTSAGVGSPLVMWTGRTSVGAGFGRTVFNIPSLLRAIYSYYPLSQYGTQIAQFADTYILNSFDVRGTTYTFPELSDTTLEGYPGASNLAFNLASELYQYPFGLLVLFKTQNVSAENIVGYFLSQARVRAHSVSIAGPSSLITEECSIIASEFHPVITT